MYTSTSEHGKSVYWVLRDRVNYYETLQLDGVCPCRKGGAGSSRDASAWYWWSIWWGPIRCGTYFSQITLPTPTQATNTRGRLESLGWQHKDVNLGGLGKKALSLWTENSLHVSLNRQWYKITTFCPC